MEKKIAISACSGMSPNDLVTRTVVDDISTEKENVISICISATSADKSGFKQLIKKYPIIAVNGCNGNCVNKILKSKGITVIDSIDVDEKLIKTNLKANDTSRLDKNGEKCVEFIKKILEDKIKK